MTSTSQEYLEYHTRKLTQLSGEDQIEYLLDSLPFIKNQDNQGYMEFFGYAQKESKKELLARAERDMYECAECGGYLIDCGGSGVCTDCAVVAWEGLCIAAKNTMTYERCQTTRVRIHRYVRLVHFKDYMRSLHGEIPCKLTAADEERVVLALEPGTAITPTTVLAALKKCKLNYKHRKHKEFLAWKLSGRTWRSSVILHADYVQMCKMFRAIERLWDKPSFKRLKGKRKVFLSYPYVFWRLAQLIGKERAYCKDVHLLKSKILLQKQHELWSVVCRKLHWRQLTNEKEPN